MGWEKFSILELMEIGEPFGSEQHLGGLQEQGPPER